MQRNARCRSSRAISPIGLLRARRYSLLDVRTREEFEAVKLPNAQLFTQELMQEIPDWSRNDLPVIYDHQGARSMDAAAYFQGHGFKNVKSLRGGIDAYSAEADSISAALPLWNSES